MASRESLVPTRTVDKNGRTTTVHVKPSAVRNGSLLSVVPVPSAPGHREIDREKLVEGLVDEWQSSRYDDDLRNRLRDTLSMYSDELLERLTNEALESFPALWMRHSVSRGLAESQINEQLEFFPIISNGESHYIAKNMIWSLHGYPDLLASDDFSKAGEKTKQQCRALLLVTDAMNNGAFGDVFKDEQPIFILKDERLVKLVINHSDKVEMIVDFIRDRSKVFSGSLDTGLLADMIASESLAVSAGLL
jgi:hypothetical protein